MNVFLRSAHITQNKLACTFFAENALDLKCQVRFSYKGTAKYWREPKAAYALLSH